MYFEMYALHLVQLFRGLTTPALAQWFSFLESIILVAWDEVIYIKHSLVWFPESIIIFQSLITDVYTEVV